MSLAELDLDDTAGALTVDPAPGRSVRQVLHLATKRAIDVIGATVLLLAALPVLVVIAVAVRRDGGPALFRQRRIGRGGSCFPVLKFRSMAVDAEDRLHRDPALYRRYVDNGFKLPADEDPRTTRLGRFLRSSSLDELPQLLNVLKGDMSLVGPRPIVEAELVEYSSRGAEDAYLSVRPGLTGPWQANGRSLVGYDDRVALDVGYVERPAIRTDVKLLGQTAIAVVRRSGAF